MTPVHDSDHVQRCLDEMKRRDVGLLVLGRESNARYLSGASRLWLSGTRPFGPGCVVVRDTDMSEYELAGDALAGSVFRMLRQGQRVCFGLDDSGRATKLSLGSEIDMGTPDFG